MAGRIGMWKPAAFTILIGCGTYTCSFWYYTKKRVSRKDHSSYTGKNSTLKEIKQWWNYQLFRDKFFYSILALNTCVYVAWRIRILHSLLYKHFLSIPNKNSTSSLLLNSFSHQDTWHFGINMLVLWSFVPPFIFGPEGSWPFYLTAGVFASSVSYYSSMIRSISIPSLGASGAIMAVVSLVVITHPDDVLYFIFLPFVPIPASIGLLGVITLDIVGLIRGWKLFDHAAHLGGVFFGFAYYQWGSDVLMYVKPKLRQLIDSVSKIL